MRGVLKFLGILLGSLCVLILFDCWSSSRQKLRDEATLDMVLSTSGAGEIEVVNEDRKRVVVGEQAKSVAAVFTATNRIPWTGPKFMSLYIAGHIRFQGGKHGTVIGYIPAYNGAGYGNYYFHLKGTNDLRRVFEWRTTNDTEAAFSR